jgi:hypothetical protein
MTVPTFQKEAIRIMVGIRHGDVLPAVEGSDLNVKAYAEADYLLAFDHPEGSGRAEFFSSFGFAAGDWLVPAHALVDHARAHPVSSVLKSTMAQSIGLTGRSIVRTVARRLFARLGSLTREDKIQDWLRPILSSMFQACYKDCS